MIKAKMEVTAFDEGGKRTYTITSEGLEVLIVADKKFYPSTKHVAWMVEQAGYELLGPDERHVLAKLRNETDIRPLRHRDFPRRRR